MNDELKLEREMLDATCRDDKHLGDWVKYYTRLKIPTEPVCPHHQSPFEYLHHAYFEPASDVVVWAPRGGGKTRLAALATLLDLLHKPGCSVRILGGSLEQSLRMWEHLFPDLTRLVEPMLNSRAKATRRISLTNGSGAAVLTQSEYAVRGIRVQKLRCDEVEQFKPHIWEAAQLVTRTMRPRGCATSVALSSKPPVAGAIEAISTFHKPWGLMSRIIDQAHARNIPVIHLLYASRTVTS